jgi:hypothetical protein
MAGRVGCVLQGHRDIHPAEVAEPPSRAEQIESLQRKPSLRDEDLVILSHLHTADVGRR